MSSALTGSKVEPAPDVRPNPMHPVRDVESLQLDPLLDPRWGDVGDAAASPRQRSLLAIAGSLLVEISLPKLLFAGTVSLLLPAVLLGIAPLVATAWLTTVSGHIFQLTEIGTAVVVLVVALGWIGWRPLVRIVEVNFWSLNALAVQPAYAFCREALRHLAERMFSHGSTAAERARLRAASSAGAGIILCGCAVVVAVLVWPASRWMGTVTDLLSVHRLIVPALANALVLVSGYLAIAALIWGFSDASMDQPFDLAAFDAAPSSGCTWRVAHLSDIHVVGERYGFRIESGRGGPRGNDRLARVMARIAAIRSAQPLVGRRAAAHCSRCCADHTKARGYVCARLEFKCCQSEPIGENDHVCNDTAGRWARAGSGGPCLAGRRLPRRVHLGRA